MTPGQECTGQAPDVTVVIPVFNAFESLRDCLASLDEHSPSAAVLVVDDASDDPRVAPHLQRWTARRAGANLLRLPDNRGFVYAANRGVAAARGDVVLLNSDTVVTAGWLEALASCLRSDERIASATPWSNNAEIVSLPEFCVANPVPEDAGAWARAVRHSALGDYPELPTAVGFCMGISRRAVEAFGLFDEEAFGRGYGEENDFSRRVANAGWRNVLCEDAYVVHRGGQSFGPLGLRPGGEAMKRLLEKHPDYLDQVTEWIRDDPLEARRRAIVRAATGTDSVRIGAGVAREEP